MIDVTEPQVWVLIGVFAAALFGLLTIVPTMFLQVMRSQFEAVHAKLEAMDRRFDGLDRRIDGLDRDVRLLMRREFGFDE